MEPFIIFVLVFFVAPAVMKAIKKSNTSAKPRPSLSAAKPGTGSNLPWNNPEFRDLKATLQAMSSPKMSSSSSRSNANQQAQRKIDYESRQRRSKINAEKRSKRLKAHDAAHGDTVESRDINDRNKNRHANWGERVGPGILNSKTLITAIVMGFVLAFLLAQS